MILIICRVRKGFLGDPEDVTLKKETASLRAILELPPFRYDPALDHGGAGGDGNGDGGGAWGRGWCW